MPSRSISWIGVTDMFAEGVYKCLSSAPLSFDNFDGNDNAVCTEAN